MSECSKRNFQLMHPLFWFSQQMLQHTCTFHRRKNTGCVPILGMEKVRHGRNRHVMFTSGVAQMTIQCFHCFSSHVIIIQDMICWCLLRAASHSSVIKSMFSGASQPECINKDLCLLSFVTLARHFTSLCLCSLSESGDSNMSAYSPRGKGEFSRLTSTWHLVST